MSVPRIAGALLVSAVVPLGVGITLFIGRGGLQGRAPRAPALFTLERSSILAAVVLTVLGFVVLETIFQNPLAETVARVGVTAYFFGAVLLAAAESMGLTESGVSTYPLIVIYVVMALLGQAAIGAAILQSGLLPAWIGWTTVIWNLAWLVILPLATPADVYFPILHHLMPLLIGIPLLWSG